MRSWTIPIFITSIIVMGTVIGFFYISQKLDGYNGGSISSLAPIVQSKKGEVAGTIISNGIDLKEVIRQNQPKVVQLEAEDGQLGSGFFYNGKGDIITNAHIVEGDSKVVVRMPDGQTYSGSVIGKSEIVDVAVVRVEDLENVEPMNIAYDYEGEVGDEVIAIGSPRGYQNTVTTGIISAVNRNFSLPPYQFINTFQISAPIAPGSSGGPLILGTTGEVIGINSAAYDGELIGFSIPIKNIWSLVKAWSEGETPEEPLSYHRITLSEEVARGLVYNFYESISNSDYVTAYSYLGSELQSGKTYEEFRSKFMTTAAIDVINVQAIQKGNEVEIIAEIVTLDIDSSGEFLESRSEVKHQVTIENDRLVLVPVNF